MSMAPHTTQLEHDHEAVALASTREDPIGRAAFAGDVTSVSYTPNANIAGVNTNTRRLRLINRGQDGNGATVIAELQFNAGVNANDFDETALPITVANDNVAQGDILSLESAAIGTGLADPGGLLRVEISRSG